MVLIEPPISRDAFRRTFADCNYAVTKEERAKDSRVKWPRLMDCHLRTCASDDVPAYFDAPKAGEFAVVDVVTKEKAWFEMPHGATPEIVHAMIESHFAARAFRVGNKLWFV